MTRFYFNIQDEAGYTPDPEGQELPDADAARREAVSATREILGETLLHGGALNHRTIEITDADGHVVGRVNSRDVLFDDGQLRSYSDDVTHSAPANRPPK